MLHRSVVALVVVAACKLPTSRPGGSQRLEYGSSQDVEDILRAYGVPPRAMACVNPNYDGSVTRGVTCTTTLTAADLARLVAAVPLAPTTERWSHEPAGTCEQVPGLRSGDPGVEVFTGRNTRVTNGAGSIELHATHAGGPACVTIRYPWG